MKTLHTLVVVSLASAGMMAAGCEHTDDRSVANSAPTPAAAWAPAKTPDSPAPAAAWAPAKIPQEPLEPVRAPRETQTPQTSPQTRNPTPVTRPMGATNVQPRASDATFVERIASARCDREQTCANIGDGRKYASRNVCMDQLRGRIANDLNSYQCPLGIDTGAVEECLAAIGAEQCGAHPVEAISRMDKCRSGAMCMK
jgi:hypothetical protein